MVLKISAASPKQSIAPSTCGMGVPPVQCIFQAGGTLHKNYPQIVPHRSHPPAFCQSHAAVRPDRP